MAGMTVETDPRSSQTAVSDLWHANAAAFADVSKGALDEAYVAIIGEGLLQSFNVTDLRPSTVAQAALQAGNADISLDERITRYYGYLREGYFARPVRGEKSGHGLGALSDQRMFALALLFAGEGDAFARYIASNEYIFRSIRDVKKK